MKNQRDLDVYQSHPICVNADTHADTDQEFDEVSVNYCTARQIAHSVIMHTDDLSHMSASHIILT